MSARFSVQLVELGDSHEKAFGDFMGVAGEVQSHPFFTGQTPWDPANFQRFVKQAHAERMDWRPSAKKVSLSRYVLEGSDRRIYAVGLMRFPLDEVTEIDGGNLTCFVPPTYRRRGFGSYCLSLLLFEAVRAGLRRALVTCDANDVAARRTIEKNRGTLIDEVRVGKDPERKIARYWIHFVSV